MRKHAIIIFTLLFALFLLAACSQQEPDVDVEGTAAAQVEATPTNTVTPTPTLPATYTPAAGGQGGHLYVVGAMSTQAIHTVQPGESLSILANRYGVTVGALAKANRILNYDYIQAGQVLFVPATGD